MSKPNNGPRGLKTTEKQLPNVVKMKFKEHKYYNDLDNPIFEAGKVYELEGAEWIQRWLKRGGEIVEGKLAAAPPNEVNPSTIVPQNPEQDGDKTKKPDETTSESDKSKAE